MRYIWAVLLLLPTVAKAEPTQILAVYNKKTLELQWVFIPTYDDKEIEAQRVGPNDSSIRMPLMTLKNGGLSAVKKEVRARNAK